MLRADTATSRLRAIALACACALALPAMAQSVRTLQGAALRSERGADAAQLATLDAGREVDLLQLSGGWAQVQAQTPSGAQRGWLRASLLDLNAPLVAQVSQLETGRRAQGNMAVTLGVRSLPPRNNRHALIVGVGSTAADAARPVEPLAGVLHDMRGALAMAQALQVPADNITLLRDAAATRAGVLAATRELDARVRAGDRVFIYWSGHGSRRFDAAEGGCVETLVPYDLQAIDNGELAQWIKPLGDKADKLLVVIDAGHAGGAAAQSPPAAGRQGDAGFRSKFIPLDSACLQPDKLRTRSLGAALGGLGLSANDFVHLASSRPDEPSWDNPARGGLATESLRQCLQGEARDSDGSGSISIDEVAACAQAKIDALLALATRYGASHLTLSGNRGFVPAWFADAGASAAITAAAPPRAGASAALALDGVLEQIHAQRDTKRSVVVTPTKDALRIGVDSLEFSVQSSHSGHVYVALLGSDRESLVLLFPNALDVRNRIGAGETLVLPRAAWRIKPDGPPGRNTVLVLVADGPRDLSLLGADKAGPFTKPLIDAQGRSRLQWLLGTNAAAQGGCSSGCSDAFGSALVGIEER